MSSGLTEDIPGRPEGVDVRGARLPGSNIWLALSKQVADAARQSQDAVSAVREAQSAWNERVAPARPGVRRVVGLDQVEAQTDETNGRTSMGPDGYMVHIEF